MSEDREVSLEEKFATLDEKIRLLEKEDVSLEEAFRAYSEGMILLKQCNDEIDRVEKQVLKLSEDGILEEFGSGQD